MLNVWCLNYLDRLGNYVIHPGVVANILVMKSNIMTLRYTYAKRGIKNPSDFSQKNAHIRQIIVWIPSRLAWTPALLGRDQ